ncbi:MAG: hypothetical protein Ta2G_15150 [Termitinemataceae bacterium]|nr:MAG: hypothetical protein Ta2G_15150 [Termitinemataceae bacterium]
MGFLDSIKKTFNGANKNSLFAPLSGEVLRIEDVNDEAFSSGALGKGIAIRPSEGKLYAPCNATVDFVFETKHAFNLIAANGAEILIHIGLDTVKLGGEPFEPKVNTGDEVKKGDLLCIIDLEKIKSYGLDTATPILIANPENFTNLTFSENKTVQVGDEIIKFS